MEERSLLCVSVLLVVAASAAAAPAAMVYWKRALPETPMPGAIRHLVASGVSLQNGGTGNSTNKTTGTTTNATPSVNSSSQNGTHVSVGNSGVDISTPRGTTVGVGPFGVNVNTSGHPGNPPVIVNVSPFIYSYAATDTQIHDDPRTGLFFSEDALRPGAKKRLHFTESRASPAANYFISKEKASSIPFSSTKLPEILHHFKINPGSLEAMTIKKTLTECELPPVGREKNHLATSLESIVEFSTKNLGTSNVSAVSTTLVVNGENNTATEREYTIEKSERLKARDDKVVACHLEEYKYAVFYCHVAGKTRSYKVNMAAGDGAKVEAVAVCHTDTAGWNPGHVAFRVLGVRPGTAPVCHFLPPDHVVWVPRG